MRAVILCSFLCLYYAESIKILSINPIAAHSHYTIGYTLAKGLAKRGHDVTIVAPFRDEKPTENLRQILLTGFVEDIMEKMKEFNPLNTGNMPLILTIPFLGQMGTEFVDKTLAHEAMRKVLESDEKFDVVIIEQFLLDGLQVIAHHFGVPSVVICSVGTSIWTNHLVGNPDIPSYMSSYLLESSASESFVKRTLNTLAYVSQKLYDHLYFFPQQNEVVHRYFPNAPHIYDLIYNTSLILLNSDPTFTEPLPLLPNMVEIGGFHIQPAKKLPDDLQNILDEAKNGIIYFSLGSHLKSKDLPIAKREAIIRTFAKLNETVLWKFEKDLPEKTANVFIRKWFPQRDVLAHPNVKLFITHGGILSTIEALYIGVPIVSIPILGDQRTNTMNAVKRGYGLMLQYSDLSEETFTYAVDEVLTNPKYTDSVRYGSKLLLDKEISQIEKAEFWIEYVVRYNGAKHLRSAALELAWYQVVSLDVIIFLITVTAALFFVFYRIIRRLGRKRQKKQKNA